jgi:hypothetical protein
MVRHEAATAREAGDEVMAQTVKGRITLDTPDGGRATVTTGGSLRVQDADSSKPLAIVQLDTLTAIRLAEALTTFVAERLPQETDAALKLADEANAAADVALKRLIDEGRLDDAIELPAPDEAVALAAKVTACPDCDGTGDRQRNRHPRVWDKCDSCNGSGEKVAPC